MRHAPAEAHVASRGLAGSRRSRRARPSPRRCRRRRRRSRGSSAGSTRRACERPKLPSAPSRRRLRRARRASSTNSPTISSVGPKPSSSSASERRALGRRVLGVDLRRPLPAAAPSAGRRSRTSAPRSRTASWAWPSGRPAGSAASLLNVPSIVSPFDEIDLTWPASTCCEEVRAERHLHPRLAGRLEHQQRQPVERQQHERRTHQKPRRRCGGRRLGAARACRARRVPAPPASRACRAASAPGAPLCSSQQPRSLPECEHVRLGATLEKDYLKGVLPDGVVLAHELVEAAVIEHAVALLVDVEAV